MKRKSLYDDQIKLTMQRQAKEADIPFFNDDDDDEDSDSDDDTSSLSDNSGKDSKSSDHDLKANIQPNQMIRKSISVK